MGLHWLQLSSSLCLINDQNLDGWSKWSDCEKSRARWIKAHPSHSLRPGLTSTLRFVTLERVKMWCFQPNSWQFVWHNSYGILKFLRGFLCKHLYIRHTVDGQINQTLTIYPRCHPRTPNLNVTSTASIFSSGGVDLIRPPKLTSCKGFSTLICGGMGVDIC